MWALVGLFPLWAGLAHSFSLFSRQPSVQKGIKANDPTIASPFFQSKIPSHVQGAAISTIPLSTYSSPFLSSSSHHRMLSLS
jgi:hypothetical protein